jgi:hypothetical protein
MPLRSEGRKTKYATPEVMAKIRDVIQHTSTPSWISSVPHNFGDTSAGSLKADEWLTLATIYLPIALVSMWGDGSRTSDPELRRVLDHTMDLFSALRLACLRTMTKSRAEKYRQYIISYVRDLATLHPEQGYRPNHHMAIHIYDFLLLFGPVRSWWCFPFERLIGQLQRLHTNHKFGMLSIS